MKTQENINIPDNSRVEYIGKKDAEDILKEMNIAVTDEMYVVEQDVVKVSEDNPVLIVDGIGECSCDIFRGTSSGDSYIAHTMPPYENVSLKKLSDSLVGPQKLIVIGSTISDSLTFTDTEKVYLNSAPSINLQKVSKILLDTDGLPFSLILDFKKNLATYFYYNEDMNVTTVGTVKI